MIEPRSGRLNPLQPAATDDFRPRYRHLGMAAEDIRLEQLLRDSLLTRIDDFVAQSRGADLLKVALFERIAEDDTHGKLRSEVGDQKSDFYEF